MIFSFKIICTLKQNIYLCTRKQNDGGIAQSVEQRTENPCVPGSIPGATTEKKKKSFRVSFFSIKGTVPLVE